MMTRCVYPTIRAAAFAIALAVAATSIADDDWSQWRGPNRDGISSDTGLMRQWPAEGLVPVWTVSGLGKGFTSVVILEDVIYTTGMDPQTTQGSLFALDSSGNLLWKQPYGTEWNGTYPGSRSTPTVNDGRIYLMTGLGTVVCLDAKRGDKIWARDVAAEFAGPSPVMGFAESLLVADDIVICTPGGPQASIVGLDKKSGDTVWQTNDLNEMSAYCSPILIERGGSRQAVTIIQQSVVGFRPESGKVLWKLPIDEDEKDQNHSITPVYNDGLLYVTSGHKTGGQMIALSPDGLEANVLWRDELLNPLHGGIIFVNGHLFGANGRGRWICLEAATGTATYEERGVGRGSLAFADGMLYCYGERGTVALVPADPAGFNIAGAFDIELGEDQHWAHPVIHHRRLYIRHGDILLTYDLRPKSASVR